MSRDAKAPVVLVGGYIAWPGYYRGMVRALEEVSGTEVHMVPVSPLDWALALVRGYGQLVFEVATVVDRALLGSEANRVVLVGHSAGGILARAYIGGDPPYGGRRQSGHRRVSRLITLGTPHVVSEGGGLLSPISRVNELFPGALHESAGLKYLSVAGAAVDGARSRGARFRYRRFVADGRVKGDGLIPVPSALLPGAEHLVLDEISHGRVYGGLSGKWYGSDTDTILRWWPEELRARYKPVRGMNRS